MTAPAVSHSGLVLDLFAGPGGWDLAAVALGVDTVGVEFDLAARLTREAAGLTTHPTLDVRAVDLQALGSVTGLIASPPCQTFSMAGKGAGREALDAVLEELGDLCLSERIDYSKFSDERTGLVLEPMRYALALQPEWVAWEQVPTVQPVWDACALALRALGYSVWTGPLHAEQYGVPQTRKRAVLIASRVREVGQPKPTHSRYYPRNPTKLDPGVLPWISMAQALRWGMDARPSMTVTGGGTATGAAEPFGNAARQGMSREAEAGRWADPRGVEVDWPGRRPSTTVAGSNPGIVNPEGGGATISMSERGYLPYGEPTWVHNRPSTTIVGSFKPEVVAAPGYRTTVSRQNAEGSVRVTVQEAGVLQSFPPEYPWQGTKTKRYQQVGNAIPPLLAAHILMEAAGIVLPLEVAA